MLNVGFADDFAIVVVVTSRYLDKVELIATEAVRAVGIWLMSVGLAFAEQKTEIVFICSRCKRKRPG